MSISPRSLLVFLISVCTTQAAPVSSDIGRRFSVGPPGASGSLYGGDALRGYNPNNPVTTKSTQVNSFQLAPGQKADPDLGFYINPDGVKNFQPFRGSGKNPTDPGPQNQRYQHLNPDAFAPPGTDSGSIPNAKWPLGLSHNRHGTPPEAGWARQQNDQNLFGAHAFAGVDMRLEPNAYRELHWHTAAEWSLVLNGSARISAMDVDGQTFYDDVQAGDVWLFPPGMPHSIQALEGGCEFLLVFNQGDFDDSGTSLVTELFLRMPKSVLAKDLRTDVSAFENIPPSQLYIFPGSPTPQDIKTVELPDGGPNGFIPRKTAYSYHFSQQKPYEVPGGSIKIIDSTSFPVSEGFSAALLEIEPGAMREIHWHATSDEWNYWLEGQGRITIYQAPESSQTFDFTAGDVGYIPVSNAHYIENTGNTTLKVLEMLGGKVFEDISAAQWLGLTPKQVVKETLNLPDETIDRLPHIKPYILPGAKDGNMLQTNFTEEAL